MGQRQSEIIKNHMEVYWHDYASASKGVPITEAGLVEKASVIGRTGLMLLECGTGAWRVRSSMNTLSRELGVTTTADIGLLSIEFTCFDGDQCYTDVERGERGSTEEHLTVTQFKVQREQERLDTLTAQADQQAQSLAKTCQTLSKKEKELAAVQKKTTLTKEALIHARDLDYIGKRTFLGNYSLTEEEFSQLKSQAAHGFMVDVENRQLKQQLSAAQQDSIKWQTRYRDLRNEVQPYLDAMRHAPERVRNFFENLLARKPERTADAPSKASRQKNAEL